MKDRGDLRNKRAISLCLQKFFKVFPVVIFHDQKYGRKLKMQLKKGLTENCK
jgi:hypothetical protein